MKNKETLEDAAKNYIKGDDLTTFVQRAFFIAGAKSDAAKDYWYSKWQKERMYSEEDLKQAFRAGEDSKEDEINGDGETPFEQWFEQFSKLKNG
jgi:hypothetical protein